MARRDARANTDKRVLQLAEPLAERREALVTCAAVADRTAGGAAGVCRVIVFRASRSLVQQVQRTAIAVSRQDPQALGLLPLDGVVTEMRPAVEATNRLLGRLAGRARSRAQLHLQQRARDPDADRRGARAGAVAGGDGGRHGLKNRADALVAALLRLARLAERLLALARAEGSAAAGRRLGRSGQGRRLTVDEFERNPRLRGRRIVGDASPARVRGDLDAVGLAVRNLVENALVHGAGGTVVRLVCGTTATARARRDRRRARREGGRAPVADQALRARHRRGRHRRGPRPVHRRNAGAPHGREACAGEPAGGTARRVRGPAGVAGDVRIGATTPRSFSPPHRADSEGLRAAAADVGRGALPSIPSDVDLISNIFAVVFVLSLPV